MPMDAKLVVVAGNANKSEIKLKLPMTIGRTQEAGLTVRHPNVSRIHCSLYEHKGVLVVRDNNSTNGTLLNDQPVREAIIKPGDKLTVGPLTFVAIYKHSGAFPELPSRSITPSSGTGTSSATPPPPAAAPVPPKPAQTGSRSGNSYQDQSASTLQGLGHLDNDDAMAHALFGGSSPTATNNMTPGLLNLLGDVNDDEDSASAVPQNASTSELNFAILFPPGSDLQVGMSVMATGKEVGSVTELSWVEENGKVRPRAQLAVLEQLSSILRTDLQMEVSKNGSIPYLELINYGTTGNLIFPGQVLDLGESYSSLISGVARSFEKVLQSEPQFPQIDDDFAGLEKELAGNENWDSFIPDTGADALPEDDYAGNMFAPEGNEQGGQAPTPSRRGEPREQTQEELNDWLNEFADMDEDDGPGDQQPKSAGYADLESGDASDGK